MICHRCGITTAHGCFIDNNIHKSTCNMVNHGNASRYTPMLIGTVINNNLCIAYYITSADILVLLGKLPSI